MVPALGAVLARPIIPLHGGSNEVLLYADENLVYKVLNGPDKTEESLLGKVKRRTKIYLMEQTTLLSHLVKEHQPPNPEKEIEILSLWDALGIPAVRVRDRQQGAIVYDYVSAPNYESVLGSSQYQGKAFHALISTTSKIRDAAWQRQDQDLLHTDNHLRNYLWSERDGCAIALDPCPARIKHGLPFEQVNALLNLELIYHLYDKTGSHAARYVKEFASSLSMEERTEAIKYNKPMNLLASTLFKAYSCAVKASGRKHHNALLTFLDPARTKAIGHILEGSYINSR